MRRPFAACGLALLILAGCSQARIGGSTPPDRVIAQLRDENAGLRRELDALNARIEARLAELEAVGARSDDAAPPQVAPPRLHAVKLGGLSGAIDSDNDGRDDLVRLYVRTLDEYGRFLPIEGQADVQIVEWGGEPRVVAAKAYDRDGFRRAYRSGIAGTHYTLEVPLPAELASDELTAKLRVTDAATGLTLTQQRAIRRTSRSPSRPAP